MFADFLRWDGKKVLEIGCGIGTDSINFVRAGARLSAVELSEESLNICKKRFEIYEQSVLFYSGNAEELSKIVPVDKYDPVYSFGVIHHSPHPELIIEEIKKYMEPDSELCIMLYSKYSWKNFLIWIRLMQPEAQSGCPIANTYSVSEVRKLLKDFEIISIKKEHIFPYEIGAYKRYEYKKVFPWNVIPRSAFRRLEQKMGWHLLIRARLANSKEK